jgi:4-alpha-glucanotransferase
MPQQQKIDRPKVEDWAEKLGVTKAYEDLQGETKEIPDATRGEILKALGIEQEPDPTADKRWPQPALDVPHGVKCYLPEWLQRDGAWGISVQIYEILSERNWGIGDFEDIKTLSRIAASVGASFFGLSPLHALFLSDPQRNSPYSPSNRLFLNPLHIAVDQLPGFREDLVDQAELARLRSSETVDYPAVARLKLLALRKLWDDWKMEEWQGFSRNDFEQFKSEKGDALLGHCLFESLSSAMVERGHGSGWRDWPEEYRDRHAPAVERHAAEHGDDIEFYAWLQWLASRQMQEAADFAKRAGLQLGLYLDFAVGEVPDGSSTWSTPGLVLPSMKVGAPPDAFSSKGQDWGLVPLHPQHLLDPDTSHYRRLIDSSARFAGALRLDHAMTLWQLFLIPQDQEASAGGYLRYPFTEMITSLAKVSQERQTVVIGEDLGNVPDGFRPALQKAGVLGYRVLYFEDLAEEQSAADAPLALSLGCLSTHDLPPLKGWWRGADIELAEEVGLFDAEAAVRLREERAERKLTLLQALAKAELIPSSKANLDRWPAMTDDLLVAAHRFLLQTRSMLVGVRLADMVGESRSTNVPGTVDEYPNWRLKLKVSLEALGEMSLFRRIAEAQNREIPRAGEKG